MVSGAEGVTPPAGTSTPSTSTNEKPNKGGNKPSGHPGHLASFCPNIGFQGVQYTFLQELNTTRGEIISVNWILLDTGSTFSSFCNGAMLSSIKSCAPMTSYTNGGQLTYLKKGSISILPKVEGYFDNSAIANILSIKDVVGMYRVTMDTDAENSIFIHTPDTIWKFIGVGNGLYYVDITDLDRHTTTNQALTQYKPLSLLNVVNSNKEYFTRREIESADAARLIQGRIGWPRDSEYKRFISGGQIRNCKSTVDDISRGLAIYGPQVNILKGKMTRKRPQHIVAKQRVSIPSPVLQFHPTDDATADFFFCEGFPFLLMKSRVYKFHGINACRGRGKIETSAALKVFLNQFGLRGIRIHTLYADNEFDKIKALIAPIHVECCGRDEHVPDIERAIRTIKERSRCTTSSLPYERIPKVMIIANLEDKCHWLNAFAPQDYICPNISPAGMILGEQPVDFNNLKLDFGQYCEVHDGTDNSQRPRSIGAIALRPKYQSSGSYYFMSLESGRKVHSNNWIELGITDAVIARVEQLAIQDGVDPMIDGELNFEWAPGVPILDVFDDNLDNTSNIK